MQVDEKSNSHSPVTGGMSEKSSKAGRAVRWWVAVAVILALSISVGSLICRKVAAEPGTPFAAAESMHTARRSFTVTKVEWTSRPRGKGLEDSLVVIGGEDADGKPLSSWEVYDPETKTFTKGGDLPRPRVGHTATALLGGSIFIAGGWDGRDYVDECAILDPGTGEIREGPKLKYPRRGAVSVMVQDIRNATAADGAPEGVARSFTLHAMVLIAGGASQECGIEYYDVTNGTIGYLPAPGATLTGATLTPFGPFLSPLALFAGGRRPDGTVSDETWFVDAATLTVQSAGRLNQARANHCAISLPSLQGLLLLIGGSGADGRALSSTEVLQMGKPFAPGPELLWPVASGSVCFAGNLDRHMSFFPSPWHVLLVGGVDKKPSARTQVLGEPYTAWKKGPRLQTARCGAQSSSFFGVQFGAWHVVVMGGRTPGEEATSTCEWSEYIEDEET